jgi:chromosome segregation ATPase
LEAVGSVQNPEASSLAPDLRVVPDVEGKETAALRQKLDAVMKENTVYLRQFQE